MASIHRDGTKPYWFCCFYDPEGFRRKRSTGTDSARIARTISAAVERASILARDNKLSNEKGLRLIRDTCTAIEESHGKLAANRAHDVLKGFVEEFIKIAGGEFTSYTIKSWLQSWIASRTDATKATLVTYDQVIQLFLKHQGQRANRPLTTLQPKEIEDFKAGQAKRVAPSTVNRAIKVLKASLNNAVARRLLEFNPAEHVTAIDTDPAGRRPFTRAELANLLTAADSKELNQRLKTQGAEWRTMILLGFYTGLRLRDCANLTWREADLLKSSLTVKTEKTGRIQVLPIADPLVRHLHTLAGDNPDAPFCPTLRGKKASQLSAAFHEVMAKAGLAEKRTHQGTGKGRDAARETGRISFHSLRYNTTSALKSAGVSDSVAMDIVGHETEAVSRNYTKIADDAKRVAINKLPDITL
jgi:integrase